MTRPTLVLGADDRPRCGWVGHDPEYERYHDEEWGVPLTDDRDVFEKICLEGFQAGLSWITILRRREGFRAAFAGFDPAVVAAFDDDDVDRLLADPRIIRNRAKIVATIGNARATLDLTRNAPGALASLVRSAAPAKAPPRPTTWGELPASTPESEALSRELRRLGFRFVGPTTMYALLQSAGVVDDHFAGCWRAA